MVELELEEEEEAPPMVACADAGRAPIPLDVWPCALAFLEVDEVWPLRSSPECEFKVRFEFEREPGLELGREPEWGIWREEGMYAARMRWRISGARSGREGLPEISSWRIEVKK